MPKETTRLLTTLEDELQLQFVFGRHEIGRTTIAAPGAQLQTNAFAFPHGISDVERLERAMSRAHAVSRIERTRRSVNKERARSPYQKILCAAAVNWESVR